MLYPDYDIDLAKFLVPGGRAAEHALAPRGLGHPRDEAAFNGVLSFSVLDGWWVEGHIE